MLITKLHEQIRDGQYQLTDDELAMFSKQFASKIANWQDIKDWAFVKLKSEQKAFRLLGYLLCTSQIHRVKTTLHEDEKLNQFVCGCLDYINTLDQQCSTQLSGTTSKPPSSFIEQRYLEEKFKRREIDVQGFLDSQTQKHGGAVHDMYGFSCFLVSAIADYKSHIPKQERLLLLRMATDFALGNVGTTFENELEKRF